MGKSLWRASAALVLSLLLAACGGAPAAVGTPGAAAELPAKKAEPQPGALLSGTIDVGDKAGAGTISIKVSDDGASIASLEITLEELKCDGLSAGRVHDYLEGLNIPMADGSFDAPIPAVGREVENYNLSTAPSAFPVVADLDNVGRIEGTFFSATEASGTIRIYMWVVMSDRACELGVFPWTTEVPQSKFTLTPVPPTLTPTLIPASPTPACELKCEVDTGRPDIVVLGITCESGDITVTFFGEKVVGEGRVVRVALDREQTYENTGNTYKIMGDVVVDLSTDEANYHITVTGGVFGDTLRVFEK